jgi:hypothetical protein
MNTKVKHRYVVRVDNEKSRTHAWKVTIKRKNKYLHKYFSDNIYGGKKKALDAAISYRNELIKEVSGTDYEIWKREHKRPVNTSGIVGVARYICTRKSGNKYPYWQAFWLNADGKRISRTFSAFLHGEEGAKQLACEARRKGVVEVERVLRSRLEA